MAAEGGEQKRGLGWIELTNNRLRKAARYFEEARALDPNDGEALAGLVASRRVDLTRGAVPELREDGLDAPVAAVVAGWRHAARADWQGVAALDAELARIEPTDALFREASRLRALWRVESGDAKACAEATAIMERWINYFWDSEDALLHARAAAAAGEYVVAWASLARFVDLVPQTERGRDRARRALEIANTLPDEIAVQLRLDLGNRASGRPLGPFSREAKTAVRGGPSPRESR
jgi:hypothetical protein